MPRRKIRTHRASELTLDQYFDLMLGMEYDPCQYRPPFASDDERREAYFANKKELFEFQRDSPGTRPGAWWSYESPDGLPRKGEKEVDALERMGLLDPGEREAWERLSPTHVDKPAKVRKRASE